MLMSTVRVTDRCSHNLMAWGRVAVPSLSAPPTPPWLITREPLFTRTPPLYSLPPVVCVAAFSTAQTEDYYNSAAPMHTRALFTPPRSNYQRRPLKVDGTDDVDALRAPGKAMAANPSLIRPASFHISWRRPTACIQTEKLRARVERRTLSPRRPSPRPN
jgi:hypothetical protein